MNAQQNTHRVARDTLDISQTEINAVWNNHWKATSLASPRQYFGHRLFIEGYPIFKKYIPEDAQTYLEIGAGTGRNSLSFARDFPRMRVVISDILDESLALIARYAETLKLKNVEVKKEDALHISFPDNFFDVVFSDVVIQHLPQYEVAITEMGRILKPGGILIVSSVNGWNIPHQLYKFTLALRGKPYPYSYEKNFTPSELAALLKKNDFDVLASDGFYPAYGVYRWKADYPIFKWIGIGLNRFTKLLDKLTCRAVSRNFGFEIFCVARKI